MIHIFFLFAFTLSSVSSDSIQVEEGKIEGTVYKLPNGRSVRAFYGVPYAAPPIGEYRFAVSELIYHSFDPILLHLRRHDRLLNVDTTAHETMARRLERLGATFRLLPVPPFQLQCNRRGGLSLFEHIHTRGSLTIRVDYFNFKLVVKHWTDTFFLEHRYHEKPNLWCQFFFTFTAVLSCTAPVQLPDLITSCKRKP